MWCKETKNVHISYKIVTKTVKCLFAHEQHRLAVKLLRGFVHICGNKKSSPRFVSMFDRYRSHRERRTDGERQSVRQKTGRWCKYRGWNQCGRKEGRKKRKIKGEMIKGMHVEKLHEPPWPITKKWKRKNLFRECSHKKITNKFCVLLLLNIVQQ